MRKLVALALAAAVMVGLAAPAAYAGSSTGTNVALGLASFAVFNQLFGGLMHPRPAYAGYHREVVVERPVYYRPVYAPPSQVVVVQPAATYPTVVQYPHGRYELRGDGVSTAYHWVWIPNAPPPPPPAAPPPPPQ
ncbi:MAG TPA: hypothetical protein VFN71_03350 [Methylomirabilota bacterium]|nr:hypothetical protein [Methylomirabilota bacterium]